MTRIVVIGGTGRIGSRLVTRLAAAGHDVVSASPSTGIDVRTGIGLDDALAGAAVVVDVSKPAVYEPRAVHAYFEGAAHTLMRAETVAGVAHHISLTVVGAERPNDVGYYKAKAAAEEVVRTSGVPFTLLRATQFFEFAPTIADAAEVDGVVVLPRASVQPIAAADVADVLERLCEEPARAGDLEIAGPETFALDDFVGRVLRSREDGRRIVAAPEGRYFGGRLDEDTLLPAGPTLLLPTRLSDWLAAGG
ncbi:NAD(P)H-binding protein [Microbacterium sp.]|uniref:SDR family oxidoreductase n=1 Tax=Microbacterium sp. TaxID=51671 RepID=UPI00334281CD